MTKDKLLVGTFEDGKTISISNEKDVSFEITSVSYLYSAEKNGAVA